MLAPMTRGQAYPPDLARYVVDHWPTDRALSLSRELLCDALSIAFQASLTSEEMRPTQFRLLLMAAEQLPEQGAPEHGVLRLSFEHSRSLTASELRRLAPSVPFETSLIGAHVDAGALRIWGIAHSGAGWLAPSWGGRSLEPSWTFDPIIHVRGPGQIAVRCAGKLVGAIDRGSLVSAMTDVFESIWLAEMFTREREEVRGEHAERQVRVASPTQAEHSLIGRVGQHMLRRAIRLIRGAGHGGMILVVDGTPTAGLRLKYRFAPDEPTRRYRTLLFQILERVAAATSKPTVEWSDFVLDPSPELKQLEDGVFELSRLISNLAATDGAVVIDKRFALRGFGAEVSAELSTPARVWRALDVEGLRRAPDEVENVGTRHRAAYRFVNDHPQGLAIVVSHDGGVTFVANRAGEIVFWEQSVGP
jgi:hypothetical protein